MSAGRSGSRVHGTAKPAQVPIGLRRGPSCLSCAILEAKLAQSQQDFARLVQVLGNGRTEVALAPPVPPAKPEQPLPKSVLRALATQFPGRTRERAEHEAMARELVTAGVSDGEIAKMITEGRPVEL